MNTITKLEVLPKVPRLANGHDAATAKELVTRFHDAQAGMLRIVALGLYAWEVKELQLKHGQWGPWIAAHCPELCRPDSVTGAPKPSHALHSYMEMTAGVLLAMGFSVEKYLHHIQIPRMGGICQGGQYLLALSSDLPPEVAELRRRIEEIVHGRSKRQLLISFKQAEIDPVTGQLRAVRGNKSGKGNPKSQRDRARLILDQAAITALEAKTRDVIGWLIENAAAQRLGRIDDDLFAQLHDAVQTVDGWMRDVRDARKGGQS